MSNEHSYTGAVLAESSSSVLDKRNVVATDRVPDESSDKTISTSVCSYDDLVANAAEILGINEIINNCSW